MFDVPLDAWYAWLGTAVVATTVLGTAFGLPTAPPPDAAAVANTVDAVAASTPPATAEYRIAADETHLDSTGITLRSDGGTAHVRFAFGPIVPVEPGTELTAVAEGANPADIFPTPKSFIRALEHARRTPAAWRATDRIIVRRVAWGGENATLVLVR